MDKQDRDVEKRSFLWLVFSLYLLASLIFTQQYFEHARE